MLYFTVTRQRDVSASSLFSSAVNNKTDITLNPKTTMNKMHVNFKYLHCLLRAVRFIYFFTHSDTRDTFGTGKRLLFDCCFLRTNARLPALSRHFAFCSREPTEPLRETPLLGNAFGVRAVSTRLRARTADALGVKLWVIGATRIGE